MDDVHRDLLDTIGTTKIVTHGVRSIVLVYNVASGYQRCDSWLLHSGNRGLGMVKGKMEH